MLTGVEIQKEVTKIAKGGVWKIIIFVLLSAVAPCFLCILSFEKLSELLKTTGLTTNANTCMCVDVRTREWSQLEQSHSHMCSGMIETWFPNNQDGDAA